MTPPLEPIPPVSATPDEIAGVTRDEVTAHAVFLRLYATLAPDRAVHALLLADMPALVKAIAEVHTQAWNAGYRAGREAGYSNGVADGADIDQGHRKAVQTAASIPTLEELRRARGEA